MDANRKLKHKPESNDGNRILEMITQDSQESVYLKEQVRTADKGISQSEGPNPKGKGGSAASTFFTASQQLQSGLENSPQGSAEIKLVPAHTFGLSRKISWEQCKKFKHTPIFFEKKVKSGCFPQSFD